MSVPVEIREAVHRGIEEAASTVDRLAALYLQYEAREQVRAGRSTGMDKRVALSKAMQFRRDYETLADAARRIRGLKEES